MLLFCFFLQQSLMKQNTKGRSKGPLIIKKLRGKRKRRKDGSFSYFLLFFWNQSFSLCVLNVVQIFSSISSPWFGKRGRGREKSAQQAANLMCNHYAWTLCAWVSWNYSSEKTWTRLHLFGLWDLTSLEAEIQGRKRRATGAVGGGQRRGKQEMKHILPWRWEVVPLSGKRFIFEG